MEHSESTEQYYAVHIPSPDGLIPPKGAVFPTLKEASNYANTPEGKARGARFKRFCSPDDAKLYALNGDMFRKSPLVAAAEKNLLGEPSVAYPSVSRIMMNRLKKTIEFKNNGLFMDLVSQNPRYLINVASDTPTIVVEGFRYNAMHLAAKNGNLFVAEQILRIVRNRKILLSLYDTSEQDIDMRSQILLDCYLNMPDKGSHETPLHFASKFGHLNVVELLISYNICQKNPINKIGLTPAQICCTRYHGDDRDAIRVAMEPLFNAYFVALYRPSDNYHLSSIFIFDDLPPDPLPDGYASYSNMLLFEICELSAYAGPFTDRTRAQKFYETWKSEERDYRRSYPRKGAERIGRFLAMEYKVVWMERWSFAEKLINLQSFTGLGVLNRYLVNKRLNPDGNLRKINFDADDDTSDSSRHQSDMEVDYSDNSDVEMMDVSNNSSLGGLTDMIEHLSLDIHDESGRGNDDTNIQDGLLSEGGSDDSFADARSEPSNSSSSVNDAELVDQFDTPPTSPEPVYIFEGMPSKDDEELVLALKLVDPQMIKRFGAVNEYMRQVSKVPADERSKWPSTDSPRSKRRRLIPNDFDI